MQEINDLRLTVERIESDIITFLDNVLRYIELTDQRLLFIDKYKIEVSLTGRYTGSYEIIINEKTITKKLFRKVIAYNQLLKASTSETTNVYKKEYQHLQNDHMWRKYSHIGGIKYSFENIPSKI